MKLQWTREDGDTECALVNGFQFRVRCWRRYATLTITNPPNRNHAMLAEIETPQPDRLKALAERINDALIEFHAEGGK